MKIRGFFLLLILDYATESKHLEDDEVCGNCKENVWGLYRFEILALQFWWLRVRAFQMFIDCILLYQDCP